MPFGLIYRVLPRRLFGGLRLRVVRIVADRVLQQIALATTGHVEQPVVNQTLCVRSDLFGRRRRRFTEHIGARARFPGFLGVVPQRVGQLVTTDRLRPSLRVAKHKPQKRFGHRRNTAAS